MEVRLVHLVCPKRLSAEPCGLSEGSISVLKRTCVMCKRNHVLLVSLSTVTHLLTPKRNPVSARLLVMFGGVILLAPSGVQGRFFWKEKGKETCGLLQCEGAAPRSGP